MALVMFPQDSDRRLVSVRATEAVSARLEAEKKLNQKSVHLSAVYLPEGSDGLRTWVFSDRLLA